MPRSGERHNDKIVHNGHRQERLKRTIGQRLHALSRAHHVHKANGGDKRGTFEHGDDLVHKGGNHRAQRLRDDDQAHHGAIWQPNGASSVVLPTVNPLDTAAHGLRNRRRAIEPQRDDAGGKHRDLIARELRRCEVSHKEQHDEGHTAKD